MKGKGKKQISCEEDDDNGESPESIMTKNNPSIKDIINFFEKKFNNLETLLNEKWRIIEDISTKVKELQKENQHLRKENDGLKNKIDIFGNDVNMIKNKISRAEMQERNRNIVIMGLPGGADVYGDVQKVLEKLDPTFLQVHFVTKTLATKGTQNPILVTFKNMEIRDKILEKRKLIPSLDSTTCGFPGEKRMIYLNEDMEKELKQLFLHAKTLKKQGYKYVWCKYGKVYVRRTDGSEVIRITALDQVSSLV